MRRFKNNRPQSTQSPAVISFDKCPAKTYLTRDGRPQLGQSVFTHCRIVGAVAQELIQRFPLKHLFPQGSAFAAANHDLGKVSPTFYNKLHQACGLAQLPNFCPTLEREWGGHSAISQIAAAAMNAPAYVPEILGQHHGFSPNTLGRSATSAIFGGAEWQQEREKLVTALKQLLNDDWPIIQTAAQARLLAGLTSVADWIGSSETFDNPQEAWQTKIKPALDDAGFIRPQYKQNLTFEQIFGFPPRLAQELLIAEVKQSGVYVLEAPMGLGKTEAALYAAYQMVQQKKASGIYFALPTQLTSNKIYQRFNDFLAKVLAETCPFKARFLGALLLHANAWLVETEMGEEGQAGGAWFNQNKRGLLAPFAVGTLDQALMAAMNVKHGFVRAFGLAGKVVILDEVHTYDAYTSTLLDGLIALLKELDCTVIILSATLNQERRETLLASSSKSQAYPLITALAQTDKATKAEVTEISVPFSDTSKVALKLIEDTHQAVEEALLRAEEGQQVLWIENTVKEAQNTYLNLAARAQSFAIDCGLLHSRFTLSDRQINEEKWVNLYGKAGHIERNLTGRILVGTQVLEQSLDIDADFLITRFAPTDMLLQRFGRLWRHKETPRNQNAQQEAWLLAPKLNSAINQPKHYFGSSAFVYSPYILCRSLEVWENITQVNLPQDIRKLIEATYEARDEQEKMAQWKQELFAGDAQRQGIDSLRQLARIGLAQTGHTLPENKAQTRYSQVDNLEVLLLRKASYDQQQSYLTLLIGEQLVLPSNKSKLTRKEWRSITAKLMQQLVYLRPNDAPKAVNQNLLKRLNLHHCFYLGSADYADDTSYFRVALVGNDEQLKGIENLSVHDTYKIEYSQKLGYRTLEQN